MRSLLAVILAVVTLSGCGPLPLGETEWTLSKTDGGSSVLHCNSELDGDHCWIVAQPAGEKATKLGLADVVVDDTGICFRLGNARQPGQPVKYYDETNTNRHCFSTSDRFATLVTEKDGVYRQTNRSTKDLWVAALAVLACLVGAVLLLAVLAIPIFGFFAACALWSVAGPVAGLLAIGFNLTTSWWVWWRVEVGQ